MTVSVPIFKLNNGNPIPSIGLGTWRSEPGKVAEAVKVALQNGYRHLDCAWGYGNEAEVGEGIKASGVKREDIFITSKLWSTKHQIVEEATNETLKKLDTDYLDLLLIHWPIALRPDDKGTSIPLRPDGSRDINDDIVPEVDTWREMEKFLATGKVKAIGVSNFSIPKLERLLAKATVVPACNQVENHPFLPQHELVEFCKSKGITVQAYSPLGSNDSPLMSDSAIAKIAEKHSCEPSNVLINYQIARGVVVLPKSVTESRIINNAKIINLDKSDMETLDNYSKVNGIKRFVKPAWGVPLEFPDF